ncbi:MAG: LemA family protein [candidate division Zixibacteria bacterium]|nr:LemA family protein [candidate division Zixibacteria bacterium]
MGFWISWGIIAIIAFYIASLYNSLVRLKNGVKNAWSQIDVQLKRRYNLIPNIVETAKGYMKHEKETLEAITRARSSAMGAEGIANKSKAENALSGAMGKFFLLVENYPDLKANTNFMAVQEELASTENRIAYARQSYNDQVLFFNNKIQMFPSNMIANIFRYTQEEYFELDDEAQREAPKVDFN